MLKFFRLPFATTGDKTAVPDAVDSNGNVSYSQGYGFDYQRQKTDPAAKNIERDKMNQILFDITTAIAELQSKGGADFITSALNGGTAYSYGQNAIVNYGGAWYISLVAANTALPTDATKWALLPTPALLQQAAFMSANAGGTVDAITATFTPAIAALPAAPGTLSVFVRATGANTSTTPTFKADGTAAKTIVKGNNAPLLAGDIAGAGHWLELQYDATLDKWVLQNPTHGFGGTPPQFDNTTRTATTAFVKRSGNTLSQFNAYAASATLPASVAGSLVEFYGSTAGQAITLPLSSAVNVADEIVIFNYSTVSVTIQRQGAEQIAYGGNGGAASITLLPGDSVVLCAGTALWVIIGGTVANKYSNGFQVSAGTAGYQVLPSGIILQWGLTASAIAGDLVQTLPIAFPNAFERVFVTQAYTAGSGSIGYAGASPTTLSAFTWRGSAVGNGFQYLAIGW